MRAALKAVAEMSDYETRLVEYRTTMSLATSMLLRGIITEKDYEKIDRNIAEKCGLSLGSICCRNPLIIQAFRVNMSPTKKEVT